MIRALLTLLMTVTIANAQTEINSTNSEVHLEIKGIRIGMDKKEVEKIVNPPQAIEYFTIAGISPKLSEKYKQYKNYGITIDERMRMRGMERNSPVQFEFDGNDRLSRMSFEFDSKDFPQMLSALKEKYPNMVACLSNRVSNMLGGEFDQVKCMISDNDSYIYLMRFNEYISSSLLLLVSKEYIELNQQLIKSQKKDI